MIDNAEVPPVPNTSGLAVKVGIFIVVGLVVLIGFSLRVTEGFGRQPRYMVQAFFDSAVGLEKDADVALGGVRIGQVTALDFDAQRRQARATLAIDRAYRLPVDSTARLERAAFLGTSIVVVRYGAESRMIEEGGEIATQEVPGISEMMSQVAEMSSEAKGLIIDFKVNQEEILSQLRGVLEENREDIRATSRSLAEAGPKLESLAQNLNEISEDFRAGKGTMGKLFTDEELYDDLKGFSLEMRQITTELRGGEGTLSRLLYDDSLARKAEDSFDKLGAAGEEVRNLLAGREEELSRIFESLADVGPRIEKAAADISEMSAKLKESEGTLGLLINDPSLYRDAQRAVNQVSESFEASEEQGVIRSFIGVLFGALI
ncbi:MAG: MCE family protein [Candidatus Sumerlaeia bacterium]|nr:MCE family protein [Candidatus Sumerlaeia bacterium]